MYDTVWRFLLDLLLLSPLVNVLAAPRAEQVKLVVGEDELTNESLFSPTHSTIHHVPLSTTVPLKPANNLSYIIMIDAGSSGTRLYVYEYAKPKQPNVPLQIFPSRHPSGKQFSAKRAPGIATIEPTFLAVTAYLGPLIQEAAAFLDPSMHNTTHIYLKATGGMRLLQNPRKMLNAVRGVLGDKSVSPFRFEERNHAGIISGEHEGEACRFQNTWNLAERKSVCVRTVRLACRQSSAGSPLLSELFPTCSHPR